MLTSCVNVYRLDSRDSKHAKGLMSVEPDVPKPVLKANRMFVPAKRKDGKRVFVRWSQLKRLTPLQDGQLQGTATNARTPLIVAGLSSIAAGVVTMLGFGIEGHLKAESEGVGKYASDGWLIGGAFFSLSALVGIPLILAGFIVDHPEGRAPMPAHWPSSQSHSIR